jgi:hypothetical protein
MKLLLKMTLISACCWAASAQAGVPVACNGTGPVTKSGFGAGGIVVNGKGGGGDNCGPPGGGGGSTPPPAPAPTSYPMPYPTPIQLPAQGTDIASIEAAFPGIVIWSFETNGSAMNTSIKGMSDRELLVMATYFIQSNGDQATLHYLASQYLDSTNLVRWQAAFSQAQVNPAVGAYSPAATSYAYFNHPALRVQIKGGGMPPALPPGLTGPPDPNINMSITEIYEEFRMQPWATPISAIANGLWWVATKTALGKAAGAGYTAGSLFYKAMVYLDPDYGWDLVTTYGTTMTEYGEADPWFSTSTGAGGGSGTVTNPDGSVYDGYGNMIAPPGSADPTSGGGPLNSPNSGGAPTTDYGIPTGAPYSVPTPYFFWDDTGACILLLGCDMP